MSGGGKGGSTTTEVKLPENLERGAESVLANALQSASLPYRPNRGVTVAAFSPEQMAAMEGANAAAAAFGMPSPSGGQSYLPQPETTAGGIQGYSTGGIYDENVAKSMSEEDIAARDAILMQYALDAERIRGGAPGVPYQKPPIQQPGRLPFMNRGRDDR